MMTRGGEGGKKCRKFDDVICERREMTLSALTRRDHNMHTLHTLRSSSHFIAFNLQITQRSEIVYRLPPTSDTSPS